MRIPSATYRIQFNPNFCFTDAKKIVLYLSELGISDLYASPIFHAREGSMHGYDVVNSNQLNPALGSDEDFNALVDDLQDRDMGWLQDIVPNHMAYDSQNLLLMDVLEHGSDSEYFSYFDVDWGHPYEAIKGKILAPLLGDFYGNCLENGEIQLSYDASVLTINYYSLKIPLRIESYAKILTYDLERLTDSMGRENPDFIKFLGILYILNNIPSSDSDNSKTPTEIELIQSETDLQKIQRKEQASFVKGLLWELYLKNSEIKEFIDRNIQIFNGEPGKPDSFNLLDRLLGEQFFRLSFWKVGAEELNYRRFFTINELICLRAEDEKVFEKTHDLIAKLVEAGKFTGLRIDHIDGLYNPTEYLKRLREKVGDLYIVVEKIIELEKEYFSRQDEMPTDWVIQGTSGYDFLDCVNSLFCSSQKENYHRFNQIYAKFIGNDTVYEDLVITKKRLIADTNLAGDIENLSNLLKKIAAKYRYGSDFTLNGLRKAILEVLVQFPVYRTYIDGEDINESDRIYIQDVIAKAKTKIPQLLKELEFLEKILLLEEEYLSEEDRALWLHFAMRFQQFSGPLMAKGMEDTSLYVYNRLISLNEVGGTPDLFGITISAFHNFNQKWQDRWPHSMNATSTHDTKRSEDVRARINVISEIPDRWETEVNSWSELNRSYKQEIKGRVIPDANDEYFLYQTLVGAFPLFDYEYPQFIDRIKDYVIKAVREAKVHTAWLRPDTDYEEGFVAFVEQILQDREDNVFLQKLRAFTDWVTPYGMLNSLSQTLLKIATPGVADFYQGTELWDLSLVDPDNRRPVDFEKRWHFLQEIKHRSETDVLDLIADLMANAKDGRLKLFLIAKALEAKKQNLELFQEGAYIPLDVVGDHQDCLVAFARHYRQATAIAIVPRFFASLAEPGEFPLGDKVWSNTRVEIPQGLRSTWKDAISGREIPESNAIPVNQALQHFPVSLSIGKNED